MAMEVKLIKEWLNALPNDARVGIDDGGLQLQTVDGQNWLEVGGLPADEEYDRGDSTE